MSVAAPSTTVVQDHMTRLRLQLMHKKLADEKEKFDRPDSEISNVPDENVLLQQAILRRQELLDKIKREQFATEDFQRPRTHSARRRRSPSPGPPPSRRSLPDLSHETMPGSKHVIEHQIKPTTPKPQYLPPLQHVPVLQPVSTTQPLIMQQPILSQPILSYPGQPEQAKWGKGDFMEMMMMQNVQMHQMVMQQMMLSSLPGNKFNSAPAPVVITDPPPPPQVLNLRERDKRPPSVHHHHYSLPPSYRGNPGIRPPVHHYTLPPVDVRRMGRGYYGDTDQPVEGLPYCEPSGDDRDNYYVYR